MLCAPKAGGCFSDLRRYSLDSTHPRGKNRLEYVVVRKRMNTARYSKTLKWTATNNNMIPVSANGRANSLDLFQRKHDKQAIQRLQRVRKIQKPSHHCSQHLGGATTIENPFFILVSTCAGLRVFIRVFVARVVNCDIAVRNCIEFTRLCFSN